MPLAALWSALRKRQTFKDFLHAHPTAPVRTVLRVLRIAGRMLAAWPWDSEEEQQQAYAKALTERT